MAVKRGSKSHMNGYRKPRGLLPGWPCSESPVQSVSVKKTTIIVMGGRWEAKHLEKIANGRQKTHYYAKFATKKYCFVVLSLSKPVYLDDHTRITRHLALCVKPFSNVESVSRDGTIPDRGATFTWYLAFDRIAEIWKIMTSRKKSDGY